MSKLVVTGPDRILEALRDLIEAIWESDHRYEMLDKLKTEIIEDKEGGE